MRINLCPIQLTQSKGVTCVGAMEAAALCGGEVSGARGGEIESFSLG